MNSHSTKQAYGKRILALICLAMASMLALSGCSVFAGGKTALETPSATIEPTRATEPPTPPPTPSPSPTPSPTPVPTPTPTPTPTPDPWAGFFSDTPVIQDPDKHTWSAKYVYKDKDLSISISTIYLNKRENMVAEIYTRDRTLISAFASAARPDVKKSPTYISRLNKAVFGITSDFWNYRTIITAAGKKNVARRTGIILRGGKMLSEKDTNETLAIMPDGDFRIFEKGTVTTKQLQDMGVKDTYSFGPVLVRDGKIDPGLKKHYIYQSLNGANTRCSIGIAEPGHYFCVVSRNVTYDQLAKLFTENLKCKIAYGLDGGYSAGMVFMGEQINPKVLYAGSKSAQRLMPDLICIGTSDKVPDVKAPVHGAANTN